MHSHPNRARRGFSLVELMVVIVIIGMLAGIVMLNVGGSTDDAKKAKAETEVNNFGRAIEMYRARLEGWGNFETTLPESLENLISGPEGFEGDWNNLLGADEVPKDPWNTEYQYKIIDEKRGTFDLRSFGADGKQGGAPPYDADIIYGKKSDDESN